MAKNRLIIVDISSFIFRAFYAIRVLHSPEGVPVNAVHGVLSMLLKLLSKYQPSHILLARDTKGGSFRNELFDQYKANRSEPPEELKPQFDLIKQLIDHMELPSSTVEGFEADDLIGSACVQWKSDFDEILIASGDKDLMQFVGDNIKMLDTMKDKTYDREGVFEKMGVYPEQIVDYLSMVGDASDNIPGMKGIGAKGAAKLLAEHGTLEKCIEIKDTLKGKKLTTAFGEYLEDGLLSKSLIEIKTDVDLGLKSTDSKFSFYPADSLFDFLRGLGFKSALVKLEDLKFAHHQSEQDGEFSVNVDGPSIKVGEWSDAELECDTYLGLDVQYTNLDTRSLDIHSLSISKNKNEAFYIKEEQAKPLLEKILTTDTLKVATADYKSLLYYSLRNEIEISAEVFDVVQAQFVANPGEKNTIESLSEKFLGSSIPAFEKKKPLPSENEEDLVQEVSTAKAHSCFRVSEFLLEELERKELLNVFHDIDNKLTPVLAAMEYEGVHINKAFFSEYEKELQTKLDELQASVDKFSKEPVNLNSPKQVGALLFEELELPVGKKTKTGYSTDSSVLEDLAAKELSEVPALILEYREVGKILSTYVKAIPELLNETSGKIHTHFNQNVAATGRLSSNHPNLQNIPIRSELGRRVRKGFIAGPGKILLAADYSQVELRLLAHFSNDKTMIDAFKKGVDIHRRTASEIMGVPVEEVGPNDRSKAKAVNFGLMYGQSSFGLAAALKIPRKEAKEYITNYFERFSSVKGYLDHLKEECEKTGYAITLKGRKRYLSDIHSTNRTIKANAERVAINSPIQGTAADIIKLAMINIQKVLDDKKLKSKMILQVHDELIFEVVESELEEMKTILKDGMEKVVSLSVPLDVDMGVGVNWFDLK
ncbi:DNA polymerase I [Halobacteriovorax marinus]|uniref:DNA polymerase I n=1 Tax=Halobacteriovorax marinus TaxID=97084 RepID=UPI000BC334A5|nr:DNA polymerase I [Halobacteriovorax marinus]ATH06635.1 DNA polymerase I [Halobacteriovorax marinus]